MFVRMFVVVTMIIILSVPAVGNTEVMTVNQWRQCLIAERYTYVWAVIDTWHTMIALEKLGPTKMEGDFPDFIVHLLTKLVACTKEGMTYSQMSAIVDKHVEENPALWHYPMPFFMLEAFGKVCKATSR
jgi:hypothetical protein